MLCDGLPQLPVDTPPGICVGIVASGFKYARGVAELKNGDLLVVDMGGYNDRDIGSVWRLRLGPGNVYTKDPAPTIAPLDRPSGIAVGPDGLVYIGLPDSIVRFDPNAAPVLERVIVGLPSSGQHSAKSVAFDPHGRLIVNIGSETNVCEVAFPDPCPDAATRASVRRYPAGLTGPFETLGTGLRNAMALVAHPTSGVVLAADNGRDQIDAHDPTLTPVEGELPHEEINVLRAGANFGWPYCYDHNTPNPEYRAHDCSGYSTAALLLPGHSAPLGMAYYGATQLLVTLHGFRYNGHRLVMVPVDAAGVPNGEPRDVIRGWDRGSPTGVMVAKDGAVIVTDDANGQVLRVSGSGAPMVPVPFLTDDEKKRCDAFAMKAPTSFTRVQNDIDVACLSCHASGPAFPGKLQLARCDDTGNATRLKPHVADLVKWLGRYPQMPVADVEEWIRLGAVIP